MARVCHPVDANENCKNVDRTAIIKSIKIACGTVL